MTIQESSRGVDVTETMLNSLLASATKDSENGAWLSACEVARALGKDMGAFSCHSVCGGAQLARTHTALKAVHAPPTSAGQTGEDDQDDDDDDETWTS